MSEGELWGWIGGGLGIVIGVAGAAFGTYCSIRRTNGPRERAYVKRACLQCFVFVSLFLTGLFLLPKPYALLLWIPYAFALTCFIRRWNEAQARIREAEEAQLFGPGARAPR